MGKVRYFFGSAVDAKVQKVLIRIKGDPKLRAFAGMLLTDYYGTSVGYVRRLRRCLKLLTSLSRFHGFVVPDTGSNYCFINTSRLDAVEKFNLYVRQEQLANYLEIKKEYSDGILKYRRFILLIFYALVYVVRYRLPLEVGLKLALLPLHKNDLLRKQSLISHGGKLLLFSDHDEFSLMLSIMLREQARIVSLVHGVPLFFENFDDIPPSSLMYKYSFVNEYVAPTLLVKNRLALLLDKILPNNRVNIHVSEFSFYSAGLQLGLSQKRKVIACLANDRWSDANSRIISIARMVSSALSLQMEIRVRPGLSNRNIEKIAKGFDLQVDRNSINPLDIYIMTHSTLYFELIDIGCSNVFRLESERFDDFGMQNGVVRTYTDVIRELQ